MQRQSVLIYVPFLAGCLVAGTAVAQVGGFVFDEPAPAPEPPAETREDPPAAPDPQEDPLAEFTFGGGATRDAGPNVPGEDAARWDAAEAQADEAGYRGYLEAFPDGAFAAEARARLAALQAAADRRQGLVTACDRMAGDPEDPGLSEGAGGVPVGEIDADAALWTCSRAVAAAPDLPRLTYNLGRIAEAQNQPSAALRNYRAALSAAIEGTGAPYLPAAAGILRLSQPRGEAERLTHVLLQLSIDGAARIEAMQARAADLGEALARATSAVAEAEAQVANLRAQVEALTAREMDLSGALAEAEAGVEEGASLAAEVDRLTAALVTAEAAVAAMETQSAALRAERDGLAVEFAAVQAALGGAADPATIEAERARTEALAAELSAARAELAAEAAGREAEAGRVAAMEAELAALRADLDAARREAETQSNAAGEARARAEVLQAEVARLTGEVEQTGGDGTEAAEVRAERDALAAEVARLDAERAALLKRLAEAESGGD